MNVAEVVSPLVLIETIRPEQGSAAFHATAWARVSRRSVVPACTTSAPGAKSFAAAWLSPWLSSWLQARTTLSGDGGVDRQPVRTRPKRNTSASWGRKTQD